VAESTGSAKFFDSPAAVEAAEQFLEVVENASRRFSRNTRPAKLHCRIAKTVFHQQHSLPFFRFFQYGNLRIVPK